MNNTDVEGKLIECQEDLNAVSIIITSVGYSSNIVPYLSKYAIIKACGTVEVAFKAIIADHCSKRAKRQIKLYLSHQITNSSRNPSYENICKLLKEFDLNWNNSFKAGVNAHPDSNRLKTSMKSLVDARNEFAHGGSPSVAISDTIIYFADFKIVLEILDSILS
jgi:hypothetical protein